MKLRILAASAVIAAGLAAATPALAVTNLIVNGGFEAPPQNDGGFQIFNRGATNLPGWEVVGPARNAVSILDTAYHEPGVTFNAFGGEQAMDMSGGEFRDLESGVRQTVNLRAGQRYLLSFWVGNADGRSDYRFDSAVTLQVNNSARTSFVNGDITANHVNWKQFTTSISGSGNPTAITFRNGSTDDAFSGLDNVRLTAVPEPATWAMMIAGFGLAGATLRRRRSFSVA
ncbi:MAG TPA: PEPxxWA-CTERM sorting domain-containing protein [Phenylobacterium sp.]|jgi:hypothetical protein